MSINEDRASVEAYAQWLLRLLDLKKVSKARRINARTSLERLDAHRVPLDHFKDAIPFDSEAALNWRGAEHGDQPADVFTIATPADVDNRLNVATVQCCHDPGQEDDGRMLLRRVRLVKRPLFPVPRAARHVVELATLAVTDEDRGVAETRVSYFGSDGTPGGLFTNLVSGEPDAQATLMLRIAFGLQFMRHYDWHVRVQGPRGTGLLIPATAAGCRNCDFDAYLASSRGLRGSCFLGFDPWLARTFTAAWPFRRHGMLCVCRPLRRHTRRRPAPSEPAGFRLAAQRPPWDQRP
ncbi:hypothetical protein ACFQ64_04505 [Streptomyces sp. NPDC056460]|uniref:hypothetical protein n=1 Tax=Streptomyces sp. NPDC056460 TaxID=3345825 RepID=UPI0036740B18